MKMKSKSMKRYLLPTLVLAGGIGLGIGLMTTAPSVGAQTVVVYKSPTCGCCKAWARHLRENGFRVEVHDRYDVTPVKNELGVPPRLRSCHTAKVGGYLVEGHVPAADIRRLLRDKPAVAGLAVPGMPQGAPGMEGPRKERYEVIAFGGDGAPRVYARYPGIEP